MDTWMRNASARKLLIASKTCEDLMDEIRNRRPHRALRVDH